MHSQGHNCRLRHANLEFTALLGQPLYNTIAQTLPQEFLVGDLVFSVALWQHSVELTYLESGSSLKDLNRGAALPGWLVRRLPELQEMACSFIANLAEEVAQENFDFVGFNLMFQLTPSLALAKAIKQSNPSTKVLFGGANCDGPTGRALHESFPFVDFVCRGEGELLLADLCSHLANCSPPLDQIPGLVWRQHDRSVCNGERTSPLINLDQLPTPVFDDWYQKLNELLPTLKPEDLTIPIESSRGCWYGQKQHCIFCGLNGPSLHFREKSPARFLRDLQGLLPFASSSLFATDLIFPISYFDAVLPKLAEFEPKYDIFYEVKANLTRQQLEMFKAAGVLTLQPGIESLNTAILKYIRKGVHGYQNIRLLVYCSELGIKLHWNLLYGFPNEQRSAYSDMARLVPKLSHLQPPIDGCCRVRLDRYSPLFEDPAAFGINSMRPAKAYTSIFSDVADRVKDLAYHYEFEDPGNEDDYRYTVVLRREVVNWHGAVGKSSLLFIRMRGSAYIADRRPAYPNQIVQLTDIEAKVHEACRDGVSVEQLSSRAGFTDVPRGNLEEAVRALVEKDWLLEIDGRLLSLATRVDEEAYVCDSVEICASIGHVVHTEKVFRMWSAQRVNRTEPDNCDV